MSFEHPVPRHLLTPNGDMTVSFAALELHMQAVFIFFGGPNCTNRAHPREPAFIHTPESGYTCVAQGTIR